MNELSTLFRLFFKLGLIGFGGPAAHIAMMEDEVVERRKWISHEQFLDLLGATSLIPGPNSTEMALHVGYLRAGLPGLVIAGLAFLFPAITLTGLLAWIYVAYGQLPLLEPFLDGIKPAVLLLIIIAVWKLGKKAVKNWLQAAIGAAVMAINLAGISEVVSLLLGGLAGMLLLHSRSGKPDNKDSKPLKKNMFFPALLTASKSLKTLVPALSIPAGSPGALSIFLLFLKIGSILFGSGYVLIAFLEGDLVDRLGWLTQQQLLDAIAIGQFTPGPVLSTATFVGYQIAGWTGAIAATLGIFLPSFVFVVLVNPLIPLLRRSTWTSAFLDAVNAGALGLMGVVILKLGVNTLAHWEHMLILALCGTLVLRWSRVNSAWLVLAGGGLGYLVTYAASLF